MNCFSILLGALLAVSGSNILTTSTPSGAGSPLQVQQGSQRILDGWDCLSSLRHLVQVSYQKLNRYPEGQSRCVATGLPGFSVFVVSLRFNYFIIKARCQESLQSFFPSFFRFCKWIQAALFIYWGIAKLVRHQTLTLARPCRSLVRVQLPQPPAASVDIPGWITTKLVENKLATIQSLYPFFAIVNGEFQVVFYGVFV